MIAPYLDMWLRLFAALIFGSIIGLNRDVNNKSTGLRTHAVVTLGAAVAVLAVAHSPNLESFNTDAASRVVQGILTGIGFLGAGVIIKNNNGHVSGLTTAATVWISAVIGAVCGYGDWQLIIAAFSLTLVILIFGGRVEIAIENKLSKFTPDNK